MQFDHGSDCLIRSGLPASPLTGAAGPQVNSPLLDALSRRAVAASASIQGKIVLRHEFRPFVSYVRMNRDIIGPRGVPLAMACNRARLSFYPPGLKQAAHRHHQAHLSIVLAGSFREVSAHRD